MSAAIAAAVVHQQRASSRAAPRAPREDVDDADDDEAEDDEDDEDAGSLVDFIVDDSEDDDDDKDGDEDGDAEEEEDGGTPSGPDALKRELDDIDPRNIVSGKRTRRSTAFYDRQVFQSDEYRRMVLEDVPEDELHAAVAEESESEDADASDASDDSFEPSDAESDDASDDAESEDAS